MSVRVAGAAGSDISKAEFVDSFRLVPYFHEMVEYFVERGYVRDMSIRAAPYDWRFAAGNCMLTCTSKFSLSVCREVHLCCCICYKSLISYVYGLSLISGKRCEMTAAVSQHAG